MDARVTHRRLLHGSMAALLVQVPQDFSPCFADCLLSCEPAQAACECEAECAEAEAVWGSVYVVGQPGGFVSGFGDSLSAPMA